MTGLSGLYVNVKLVTGVVLPLCVLAVALVRVDPVLLGGAALALGVTFGVAYAYARYVELGDGSRTDAPPWSEQRRTGGPGIEGDDRIERGRDDETPGPIDRSRD